MNWQDLHSTDQLSEIDALSAEAPVLIFKHSTRCSISAAAKSRLDRGWDQAPLRSYYLDLLQFRPVSNAIADRYGVEHESPQVLIIRNGKSVYQASHIEIRPEAIEAQLG